MNQTFISNNVHSNFSTTDASRINDDAAASSSKSANATPDSIDLPNVMLVNVDYGSLQNINADRSVVILVCGLAVITLLLLFAALLRYKCSDRGEYKIDSPRLRTRRPREPNVSNYIAETRVNPEWLL